MSVTAGERSLLGALRRGDRAALAVRSDQDLRDQDRGTLWCWGNAGPLGDGGPQTDDQAYAETMAPKQLGSDSDWSTVMTAPLGNSVACAIKTDGSLWC